jgi:hypothetical protein
MNKLKQGFFFTSFPAQRKKAEDSLCVELKKVKREVILKVEAHRIFVLCSKEIMQQGLGREKRSSRGVFFCVVFS